MNTDNSLSGDLLILQIPAFLTSGDQIRRWFENLGDFAGNTVFDSRDAHTHTPHSGLILPALALATSQGHVMVVLGGDRLHLNVDFFAYVILTDQGWNDFVADHTVKLVRTVPVNAIWHLLPGH